MLRSLARLPDRLDAHLERRAADPLQPRDAAWIHWVANLLSGANQAERALGWLNRAWPVPTDGVVLSYLRGRLLYGIGRTTEAEALFRCTAEQGDDATRLGSRLFLARLLHRQGRLDEATDIYQKVLALQPNQAEAAAYVTRRHIALRHLDNAEATIAAIERAEPGHVQLVPLRSALLQARGDVEGAVALYRDAIAAEPGQLEYRVRFADMLADLGRLDKMAEVLDAACNAAPDSPAVFSRLLRCAQLRNAPAQETLEVCEAFLRIDPGNPTAMLQRANLLLRSGRRDDALEAYLAAARQHPGNVTFWRSAAAVALSRNRRALAREIAGEAAGAFAQETPEHLASRADVLQAAGAVPEALEAAEAALALAPDLLPAHEIAARLRMREGQYDRAWPHLLVLKDSPTRNIQATRLFGQVAAGFRYLRPGQADLAALEPVPGRFPDVMMEKIVANSPPMDPASCNDLVMHVSSTLASGGAERQVSLTVAGFRDAGRQVEFIGEDLDPGNARDFFLPIVERAGVPVHVLRDVRATAGWREMLATDPATREAVHVLAAMPQEVLQFALPLLVILRRRRPRVVHLWQDMVSIAGGLAAILAGVPRIVLATRSTRPAEIQRARPYFHAAYKAFLHRKGLSILANSRNGAADYEDWLELPAGSIDIVYNGFDFADMRRLAVPHEGAARRAGTGIPADALVLGGVMRCSSEKRPELWTRVACELAGRDSRVHGLLVGEGPMRAELMAEVKAAGLDGRIHFVGRQSPIEPWMQAMDVMFLSSLTEGLPNVLIEAQSIGVPVATMRVGGAPETVREGVTAAVVDEGTPAEIANHIGALLLDAGQRRAFSAAGIAWTNSTFSVAAMLARLDGIYARAPETASLHAGAAGR